MICSMTAPDVLVSLLAASHCPPLREFYELVLRAHAAGVLVTDGERVDDSLAVRWPVRLPAKAGIFLGTALWADGAQPAEHQTGEESDGCDD